MEVRFGHDFSRVRVHDDARAAAVAASISAAAFTVGSDIVFGRGRHDEGTGGDRLLAHELAHVVQGGRSGGDGSVHRFTDYNAYDQSSDGSNGWQHPYGIDLRVADDGRIAVDNKGWNPGTNKHAWTTPTLITSSNSILGAQGSHAALRPKPGGRTVAGLSPDGRQSLTLTEIEPFRPAGGDFSLISDCGSACRQIIGSGPAGTRDVAVLRSQPDPGSKGTGGAWAGGILGFLAGAGAGAALGSLLGPLGAIVGGLVGGITAAWGGSRLGRSLARREPRGPTERATRPHGRITAGLRPRRRSSPVSCTSASWEVPLETRHWRATRPCPVTSATSSTGGTASTATRGRRWARASPSERSTGCRATPNPGRNAWNFHYAAAVLESGQDYLTLESAAGWRRDDWIFYMYGPPSKRQSFHEEQAGTGAHGTRQTSLVVLPEFRLDVQTKGPATPLRTSSGPVTLPANQQLRVLERRTLPGRSEEVRVRVIGGPQDGIEGWVAAGSIT